MSAVKLRDFFEMQSSTGMDAHRKAQIFSTIRNQTQIVRQTTPFSLVRNSWYFKTTVTAALAFSLMYVLYTPVSGPLFQSNKLLVARMGGNIAQAGYVGSMVATQGQITIVRNGVTTTTSQLQGGDVIYLYNTSKADFVLRDGSRGSVEGPAQLTIVEHKDSGLIVTVDHARYMQIDKSEHITDDSSATQPTNENLVIETNTSRIMTNKGDTVHLALVTTQDRQFIQNKGDEVTIESIVPATASPVTQQLASSHVADVTDAVKVYTQVAAIYDELKTQSTSQTYDISDENGVEINDMKRLLAFDISKRNSTTEQPSRGRTVALIDTSASSTTIVTSPEVATDLGDDQNNSFDNIPVYDDTNNTPVALLTMRAVNNNMINESDSGSTVLASKDAAIVATVLGQALEQSSDSDVAITTSSSIEGSNKPLNPLTNSQLSIMMKLSSRECISSEQLTTLQSGFDIDYGQTLSQTVTHITDNFYLTNKLSSILNSLTSCDDN